MEGKELAEYERDMQESNRRFDQAFRQVLSHTSQLELREFGKLFSMDGKKTHDAWDELLNMHATDSASTRQPKPLPEDGKQEAEPATGGDRVVQPNPLLDSAPDNGETGEQERLPRNQRALTIDVDHEHTNPLRRQLSDALQASRKLRADI